MAFGTIETPEEWLARYIKDSSNALLDTSQLRSFVIEGIRTNARSYTFTQRTPTVYTCSQLGPEDCRNLLYFSSPTSPLTEESGITYEVYCTGHIFITVGTPVATSISVTGAEVDLRVVMPSIYTYLASRAAKDVPTALGGMDYDPVQQERRLLRMAEQWRGVM